MNGVVLTTVYNMSIFMQTAVTNNEAPLQMFIFGFGEYIIVSIQNFREP